jgi:5-(carboxyamino)imidazole ribonucleotide synthase
MVNLIGFIPPVDAVLAIPETHLHLYDKEVRAGRKVGHVNITAHDEKTLHERITAVEALVH